MKKEFTALYERESDALFRYCLVRVGDREKAIDIAQDVFVKAWQEAATEGIGHPRAYLFTLAKNAIIDWYRRKKAVSLDAALENDETGAAEPSDEKTHADIPFSTEAKRVLAAVKKLEPTYRDVLELRFTEDLSPAEIAEIIGETANVVSVRINRGIEKLKEIFHTNHAE
ncbi:sigma-70 family RNA polymerase sigma factor [Patescibacteria group bacterium]|nr:sigma-70 family RNA polymerase sigma factor [Patescibacteria group bacterium]